jgi:hypothetical protein
MLTAALCSLILIFGCVSVHYEALRALNDYLPRAAFIPGRAKVLAALAGAMASHFLHVSLFALAYFLLRDKLELGNFAGHFGDTFASFLYFSTESYTTVGFGDIYPAGPLRLLVGFEALTGLLLISWSGSFSYLEMRRYW